MTNSSKFEAFLGTLITYGLCVFFLLVAIHVFMAHVVPILAGAIQALSL